MSNNYLNQKHFNNLLNEHGEEIKNFDNVERLSSKAMLYSTGTKLFIFYVNTLVFKKDLDHSIELNAGGWYTDTTKKHINHGLDLVGSNYYIKQKAFKWYLVDRKTKEEKPFQDNIILNTTLKKYVKKQVESGRFKD